MTTPFTAELADWSRRPALFFLPRFLAEIGSSSGPNGRAPKPSVLLVEDDGIVAEMYRMALIRAGYDVHVAGDGLAGLETATAKRPDFAFLDVRMPRMDGLELLRRLRANDTTRELPVVMLTNFDDASQVNASMQLGAKQYVVKTSVLPADLPGIVARWLPREPTADG
jgi:CheY-like chemotaxis protein